MEATIAISYYVVPRRGSRSDHLYGIVPIGEVFKGEHGRISGRPEAGDRPNRGELWLSGSQVISRLPRRGRWPCCLRIRPGRCRSVPHRRRR